MDTSRFTLAIWDAFSILCQGTIAGLVVLWVTAYLQRKKEKDLICKTSLLVWLELHSHLAALNDILLHKKFPESQLPISLSTSTWKEAQIHLTSLPVDELKLIGSYYQTLPSVNHLIQAYAGKELTPIMLNALTQSLSMCEMTRHLLASYWDSKNFEMHHLSFLHMRQQYRDLV